MANKLLIRPLQKRHKARIAYAALLALVVLFPWLAYSQETQLEPAASQAADKTIAKLVFEFPTDPAQGSVLPSQPVARISFPNVTGSSEPPALQFADPSAIGPALVPGLGDGQVPPLPMVTVPDALANPPPSAAVQVNPQAPVAGLAVQVNPQPSLPSVEVKDNPPPPKAGLTVQAKPGPAIVVSDPRATSPTILQEWLKLFSTWLEPSCRRVWSVEAEYVLWFYGNSSDSLPIATTNFLGSAGASVLGSIGDAEHARKDPKSGARLALGWWQIMENPWVPAGIRDFGAEAAFFVVGGASVSFANDLSPNLVRPFFDLNNRVESGFIVAAPGLATGNINARAQGSLWGAELNAWKNIYYNTPGTSNCVDVMAGLRFLNSDQQLTIGSTSVYNPVISPASPFFPFAGNRLDVVDSFATHNRFFGGQVGVAGKCWPTPRLTLEGDFKLALGFTSEDLSINGGQFRTFANGSTAASTGGVLALPSNIGQFSKDRFAQVPELDLKISYELLRNLTFSTNFSALYWNRIARAAQQIDREIDITQIPNFPLNAGAVPTGLARPAVPFTQSDLWVLGFSLGLEYKW